MTPISADSAPREEGVSPVEVTPRPRTRGSPNPKQYDAVSSLLREKPELIRRPKEVSRILGIARGSAKRLCKQYRDRQRGRIFGPILLQDVHIVGRTDPDTVSPGSPPLNGLPVTDKGDNKLTATIPFPPDGEAIIRIGGETLELHLAAPRGLTPSEVLLALPFLRLPWDKEGPVTFSFEALRDGCAAFFEGVEARTYRSVEGLLLKAYNHTDGRGTLARLEVRPPAVRLTWTELEAFFEGRQPLGRDAKIEALTLQVEENSRAIIMLRREVKQALEALRGGSPGFAPGQAAEGSQVVRVEPGRSRLRSDNTANVTSFTPPPPGRGDKNVYPPIPREWRNEPPAKATGIRRLVQPSAGAPVKPSTPVPPKGRSNPSRRAHDRPPQAQVDR